MAFQTVDQWKVERSFALPFNVAWLPAFPTNLLYRDQIEKICSVLLAIIFNGIILYIFVISVMDWASEDKSSSSNAETNTITMIDLGNAMAEDPRDMESGSGEAETQPTALAKSDIEVSKDVNLPAEWSLSPIAVPRPVTNVPSTIADVNIGVGDSTAKGGNRGGGVYDPYAGAAPNRKPELEKSADNKQPKPESTLAGRISGFFGFSDGPKVGADNAFEQWVKSLRARLPRAKGSVLLSVTLDRNGIVRASEIVGGNSSLQVRYFVRNAVIGQDFSGASLGPNGSKFKLPDIIFK